MCHRGVADAPTAYGRRVIIRKRAILRRVYSGQTSSDSRTPSDRIDTYRVAYGGDPWVRDGDCPCAVRGRDEQRLGTLGLPPRPHARRPPHARSVLRSATMVEAKPMTTYHPSLKAGRGRRTAPVPLALRQWLQNNPSAWSGWPTFDAHDYEEPRPGSPGSWLQAAPASSWAPSRRSTRLSRSCASSAARSSRARRGAQGPRDCCLDWWRVDRRERQAVECAGQLEWVDADRRRPPPWDEHGNGYDGHCSRPSLEPPHKRTHAALQLDRYRHRAAGNRRPRPYREARGRTARPNGRSASWPVQSDKSRPTAGALSRDPRPTKGRRRRLAFVTAKGGSPLGDLCLSWTRASSSTQRTDRIRE